MTAKKIKILIADDHALIRDGLKKILGMQTDMQVAGEAADGAAACRLAVEVLPDVVLMDINMPVMNGIEATRLLRANFPHIGIIALTIHDEEEYIYELVRAGVSAYALKDIETDSLLETIRAVARGENVLQPNIARKIFGEFQRLAQRSRREETLSSRELDVLVLIARGKTNKEIGDVLYISEKTVKNHVTNIFRKINVSDRTQAALYAVKNRIVKL